MHLQTSCLLLRDFVESDRAAFVTYQMDPRYRALYDFDCDDKRAHDLFDLFISWGQERPRRNFQVGVFDRTSGRLCGCAGLRQAGQAEGTAILGIELTPDDWGRYRLAIDAASLLIEHGFRDIGLHTILGSTASGNKRVERLARWFGADIVARRDGPDWMRARGWSEVDWALTRESWERSGRRLSSTHVARPLSRSDLQASGSQRR